MEMMVRLARENNQTFILVTHDQELSQYADRIITLIDGRVVSDQPNVSLIDRTVVDPPEESPAEGSASQEEPGTAQAPQPPEQEEAPEPIAETEPDSGSAENTQEKEIKP